MHEDKVAVYNFSVEDWHTYFVGGIGLWVHNAKCKVEYDANGNLLNGPYIRDGKPNGRPKPSGPAKTQFEQNVYNASVKGPNGNPIDPNTKTEISWSPGQSRNGNVDFGHKTGYEYRSDFEKYKTGRMSLDDLKKTQADSKNFQLESVSGNRGHQFESK